jgi:microcystin degradation protein MlrC
MLNLWRTSVEPMRGFVDRMGEIEDAEGALSISFIHGFPWGDVADIYNLGKGSNWVFLSDLCRPIE